MPYAVLSVIKFQHRLCDSGAHIVACRPPWAATAATCLATSAGGGEQGVFQPY